MSRMSGFKKEADEILLNLKTEYGVLGLKAEYEAEGATLFDILLLKELAKETGLKLSVKISGPQGMRDIYELKEISPDTIIAPMIESSYAAFCFCRSVKKVFPDNNIKLFIGIETDLGFKCLDEILSFPCFNCISGVVIGRNDLMNSINFTNGESGKKVSVDSDTILDYAVLGGKISKKYGKKLITGGLVTEKSIPFLKSLKTNNDAAFDGFETRKIIFSGESIEKNDINKGILLALKFEMMWLQNKIDSNHGTPEDKKRLEDIQNRYYDKR